ARMLGGESYGSLYPKSVGLKIYEAPAHLSIAIVWSDPFGASFTDVTLIVTVFGIGSRSAPPLAVPPLSCTWNVNCGRTELPSFAFVAGVNDSPPICEAKMKSPA